MMMAVLITSLAIGSMVAFYMMSQKAWVENNTRVDVQRQARVAMDKMVRGENGTNGIREATSITVPDSATIQYISGIDAVERSFYLDGNDIMYDPDTAASDDESAIAWDVRTSPAGLIFTVNGSVVTIEVYIEDEVNGKAMSAALSTKVKIRN